MYCHIYPSFVSLSNHFFVDFYWFLCTKNYIKYKLLGTLWAFINIFVRISLSKKLSLEVVTDKKLSGNLVCRFCYLLLLGYVMNVLAKCFANVAFFNIWFCPACMRNSYWRYCNCRSVDILRLSIEDRFVTYILNLSFLASSIAEYKLISCVLSNGYLDFCQKSRASQFDVWHLKVQFLRLRKENKPNEHLTFITLMLNSILYV